MKRASILVWAALVAAAGCGPPPDPVSKCGPTRARVTRVLDGDTVEIDTEAKDGVRYLLIDAPEIAHNTKEMDMCYSLEARAENIALVEGKDVTLAYDEAQCRDRYNRLLAYVSVAATKVEVNKHLVEGGFACVYVLPPAGVTRELEFKSAQADAKAAMRGVWGACNPVTCVH